MLNSPKNKTGSSDSDGNTSGILQKPIFGYPQLPFDQYTQSKNFDMSPCKHWKTIADAVTARKSRSFLANFNTYYEEKIESERRTEKYPFSPCGSKIRRVIE